jgi:hypothetical protein
MLYHETPFYVISTWCQLRLIEAIVIEYHVGTFTIPGTTTRLPSWQGSAIWQELLPQFVRFLKKTEILQVDNVKQRNTEILFSIYIQHLIVIDIQPARITLNFAHFAEHPSQISIIQKLRNSTRNNTVIEYHVGTFTIPQRTF